MASMPAWCSSWDSTQLCCYLPPLFKWLCICFMIQSGFRRRKSLQVLFDTPLNSILLDRSLAALGELCWAAGPGFRKSQMYWLEPSGFFNKGHMIIVTNKNHGMVTKCTLLMWLQRTFVFQQHSGKMCPANVDFTGSEEILSLRRSQKRTPNPR